MYLYKSEYELMALYFNLNEGEKKAVEEEKEDGTNTDKTE